MTPSSNAIALAAQSPGQVAIAIETLLQERAEYRLAAEVEARAGDEARATLGRTKQMLEDVRQERDAAMVREAALFGHQQVLTWTLRSTLHTLETIDAGERYNAREERRAANVHTSAIQQAKDALAEHALAGTILAMLDEVGGLRPLGPAERDTIREALAYDLHEPLQAMDLSAIVANLTEDVATLRRELETERKVRQQLTETVGDLDIGADCHPSSKGGRVFSALEASWELDDELPMEDQP